MKKLMVVVFVLVVGLAVMGCASVPLAPQTTLSQINTDSVKVASEDSTVVLGIFGSTMYPSAIKIAEQAGITKIASIEYSVTPGILGITMKYTTTVSGN